LIKLYNVSNLRYNKKELKKRFTDNHRQGVFIMKTKWDIDSIYNGVNSAEFQQDYASLTALTGELRGWADTALEGDEISKIEQYTALRNKIGEYDKLSLYVSLALSVNSTDEALLKADDRLNALAAECAYPEAVFTQLIQRAGDKKLEKYIEESELLKEHSFFLMEQSERAEHSLKPEQEEVIARLKQNGSMLWQKQWEQLTSNLEVDYNGKSEPLTVIRNLAYSADKAEREAAYKAELKAYEKIELPAAFCLNGIKGEVISVAEMRGYLSPLDMTLAESRLDSEVLDTMFGAVDKRLDALQQYFIKKANKLGHKGGLPFYDLFAPVTENEREYTLEEAVELVLKCFYGFSKELGDFAKSAVESCWIDFMPQKGKVGGAFCETIHSLKQSRILTNFGGSFNDVLTIAHELGHAFHNTRLFHLSELNSFYPMPIAETASNLCELIVINEVLKGAEGEERLSILENDLQGATQCIVDIYSRFKFEDSVFKGRKDGTLSSKELCALMTKAQREAYGKGLEENSLHPYMWLCKPHYYDADFNYYNFPYAFGLLLARGLYSMYRADNDGFVKLYDKLLAATSTRKLRDVAAIAGIDLASEEFWLRGLDEIAEEIKDY
jgi:pepF/M3 family oligoendopeptidase